MYILYSSGAHISRSISDSETLHEPADAGTGLHSLRMSSPKPETLEIKQAWDDKTIPDGEKTREAAGKDTDSVDPSRPAANGQAKQPDREDRGEENNHPNVQVSYLLGQFSS